MKFSEMVTLFEANTDTRVDSADLAQWFNEAQLDLAFDFAPVKSYTYADVSANSPQDPPDDNIMIMDCDMNYETNAAGQLIFSDVPATIMYRYMPPETSLFVSTEADRESYLPKALHHLMVLWACYRYYVRDGEVDSEEMTAALRWQQDYYIAKNMAKNRLDHSGGGNVRQWTII